MPRLVLTGVLAALFFASTFVLNRAMSLGGGPWAWTASLRFGWMLLFLPLLILARRGPGRLAAIFALYLRHWPFWTLAGGIGFGVFYSLLSFSSARAPGWIVATTWQTTILATPLVLAAFGKRVPPKGLLFTGLIFGGILLVNLEAARSASLGEVLLGVLPVVVAAFAYPLGNQLVWEARRGRVGPLPHIEGEVMDDDFARVLLLSLGSLPFWALLLLALAPPPPAGGQVLATALVALLSGVVATTLFLGARGRAKRAEELAAVDSTQAMEVLFSLAGEVLFLGGALPGPLGFAGLGLVLLGLVAYTIVGPLWRKPPE